MISFNFDYYIPSSITEATSLYSELKSGDEKPIYYGGGTEIITFARRSDLYTGAVIDLKGIPECNVCYSDGNRYFIGATVALTAIQEIKLFPLLTETSAFAADHTARNKITIGGNICGRIIYKEAVLTPLVTDAQVVLAGSYGVRIIPLNTVFHQKMNLQEGEFLVQIIIDAMNGTLPYYAVKRTKLSKAAYPLVSMAAVKKNNRIQFAFSGVTGFPFRSQEMEHVLNQEMIPTAQRVEEALRYLPAPILSNLQGGKEYREFVLKGILLESMRKLGVR